MKKLTVLLLVALTLVAMSSYAFAWAPRDQGRPDAFRPGDSRGYFIWHDYDGLHIWTSTRGARHEFSGVIRTDGAFFDVQGKRLEGDDFFRVDRDRDTIQFRFETAGGADGINFRIDGGSYANFDLFIDGHRIDPGEIYIGDRNWHPRHSDFTLYR